VSFLLLGGGTERNTHGGTPRRMANLVDNLLISCPGGSSIEPSASSSYGIDMIALTGTSRSGSKIEIPVNGKLGQGVQAGSTGVEWG
jgi:hypothetical protein